MKVSKQQSQANREAILDAAAKLYRERGFDGVGVTDITREAGFTHGGFYGHFESKEALAAEACDRAFDASLQRLAARLGEAGGMHAYIANYLSVRSRDNPGLACPMAGLAADAGRESGAIAASFGHGIGRYLQALARQKPGLETLDSQGDERAESISEADRRRAITTLASLVGAMVLARATSQALPALSDEILATIRCALQAELPSTP